MPAGWVRAKVGFFESRRSISLQLIVRKHVIGPKFIEQLTAGIASALPSGADQTQADLARNVRAAVSSILARMDLVTREEFDAQTAVLARTREKLEAMEKQVALLEKEFLPPQDGE